MINIVLFGAPGCGKGTQAQRLKAHYGIEHVSTGEVIRDEIRRGTELGRSMESYIKAGKLAPPGPCVPIRRIRRVWPRSSKRPCRRCGRR